jgi:hypothetical protein
MSPLRKLAPTEGIAAATVASEAVTTFDAVVHPPIMDCGGGEVMRDGGGSSPVKQHVFNSTQEFVDFRPAPFSAENAALLARLTGEQVRRHPTHTQHTHITSRRISLLC